MEEQQFEIIENKIVIRIHDTVCQTAEELLSSMLFKRVLALAVKELEQRHSYLLDIFTGRRVNEDVLQRLVHCLVALSSANKSALSAAEQSNYADLLRDPSLLNDFVEFLYNFWRRYDRFIICDSLVRDLDKKPYRTFNSTIGQLTQLIRGMYRDIQENITDQHPRIYRQVNAGAEVAAISVSHDFPFPEGPYQRLNTISVVRQVLLNPPLILNSPMNKRKGEFVRIGSNPLIHVRFGPRKWICYPAKVGKLLVNVYIHHKFLELGMALCNLFELASDEDLSRKPDAVYLFGVPPEEMAQISGEPTVFFEDTENDILVGAVPNQDEFGYFGYLKKMVLTLHNIVMMKKGLWPFHGALVKIVLQGNREVTVLFVGDTGAGKSETLEALRGLGADRIQDLFVIADDMGSVELTTEGEVRGIGTEIGAFLRLDDLNPGYALGQIDRAIIMNANQVNARIILPVTTYEKVIRGQKIDYVFYANNYEAIDADHPLVERFETVQQAFHVFKEGAVMSKGTTDATGIVHTYFSNIFGPVQYRDLHETIAQKYFQAFFKQGIFVGQMRTRLGLKGFEQKGPEEAARALLALVQKHADENSKKKS